MPNQFLTGLLPAHIQSKILRQGNEDERAHEQGEEASDASQNQYGLVSRPHGADDEYIQQQDSTAEHAAKGATEEDNGAASRGDLYEQRQSADKEDNFFTSGVDGVEQARKAGDTRDTYGQVESRAADSTGETGTGPASYARGASGFSPDETAGAGRLGTHSNEPFNAQTTDTGMVGGHQSYVQEGEALTANRDPRVASNSRPSNGGDSYAMQAGGGKSMSNQDSYQREAEGFARDEDASPGGGLSSQAAYSSSTQAGSGGSERLFHGHHTTRIGEDLDPHLGQQDS